jgi:hypothetical protein
MRHFLEDFGEYVFVSLLLRFFGLHARRLTFFQNRMQFPFAHCTFSQQIKMSHYRILEPHGRLRQPEVSEELNRRGTVTGVVIVRESVDRHQESSLSLAVYGADNIRVSAGFTLEFHAARTNES